MIDKDYLQREYVDKKRSAKEIGIEVGKSDTQVRYWVRKHGLPIHPRGGTLFTKSLVGQTFGDLKVLKQLKGNGNCAIWECECSCGNLTKVKSPYLRRLEIKSCGKCKEHYNWKGCGELSGHYFAIIKTGANKRKIPFSLCIQELWELFLKQNRECALSGDKLHFARSYGATEQTASLDRIDSSKGYTIDNVQWIHKEAQTMKWNLSEDRFFDRLKKIYEKRGLGLTKSEKGV